MVCGCITYTISITLIILTMENLQISYYSINDIPIYRIHPYTCHIEFSQDFKTMCHPLIAIEQISIVLDSASIEIYYSLYIQRFEL